MKIQQTDEYPCGAKKMFARYEFWGIGYSPNTGRPGCPEHGRACGRKTLSPAQLEEAKRILAMEA